MVSVDAAEFQDIIMRTTIEPFEKSFRCEITYDIDGSAAQNYAKIPPPHVVRLASMSRRVDAA